jgi:hypothetical protein
MNLLPNLLKQIEAPKKIKEKDLKKAVDALDYVKVTDILNIRSRVEAITKLIEFLDEMRKYEKDVKQSRSLSRRKNKPRANDNHQIFGDDSYSDSDEDTTGGYSSSGSRRSTKGEAKYLEHKICLSSIIVRLTDVFNIPNLIEKLRPDCRIEFIRLT